jgi:outer membrane protein assembly factor BamE
MQPVDRKSGKRRALTLVVATLVSIAATACVYRPTIQQGNLLQLDEVEQVKVGMTRSQVRYLLGTPMVSDPFQPDRWDYVYTLRIGRDEHVDRAHFVVYFEGDKVSRFEKRSQAQDSETALRVKEERRKKAEAEAKAAEAGGAAPAAGGAPAAGSVPATTPAPAGSPPPPDSTTPPKP